MAKTRGSWLSSNSSILSALACIGASAALLGCGARTELLGPPDDGDAGVDATTDALPDVADVADVADTRDTAPDVLPDTELPDVVVKSDCPDPSATYVYVLTAENELLSFYPPSLTFRKIGDISCPDPEGTTPNSMAVDRKGKAYAIFQSGRLYQLSTKTAACTPTAYVPRTDEFQRFGMGFATDLGGPSETLYVASYTTATTVTEHLGSIAIPGFRLTDIGPLPSGVLNMELTGTGDGRLYGFHSPATGADAHVAQLDKTTGALISDVVLPGVQQLNAWAFGFWGGDFWLFTAPSGTSKVTRYRPSDKSIVDVASYPGQIVGAGVSTCAPES